MTIGKVEITNITKSGNKATVTVLFEFRGKSKTKEYAVELKNNNYDHDDPGHVIFSLGMENAIKDLDNINFDEEND